jgi:predicted RND superfamily exporter protein
MLIPRLKFSFNFDQFFPKNDPDLNFYKDFIEEFEPDNNFLLVAVKHEDGVFNKDVLNRFHELSIEARDLPGVIKTQAITQLSYPIKTPFGWTSKKVLRWNEQGNLTKDIERILSDERLVGNFVDAKAKSLVLHLKTEDLLDLKQSEALLQELEALLSKKAFKEYHLLGSPYFQAELIEMEKKELLFSTLVSLILVSLIIYLLYRRKIVVGIVLASIGLGLLVFLGALAILGRELNVLTAFYPVLMLIVGTSDVVHIMTKYLDELRNGLDKKHAIQLTMRQIGMATLLTSLTTSAGFLSLTTSRLTTIQDFGVNAALGVILAFVVVFFFTTALLVSLDENKLKQIHRRGFNTDALMDRINSLTIKYPTRVVFSAILVLVLSIWGISKISTNYRIDDQLPRNSKVKEDFKFFEENYAGFRPIEFAVETKQNRRIQDLETLKTIESLEKFLEEIPSIGQVSSLNIVYKTILQGIKSGQRKEYRLPESQKEYEQVQKFVERMDDQTFKVLVNKEETKTRVSAKILDIGADSIKALGESIDQWIASNIDTSVYNITQTGIGLILDKNSIYVRDSLIKGLGLALLIVSLLMAFLFKDIRMLIVSIIPNVFPLIIAAGVIGFFGIELEAGITIIFAIAFGIAVDDTIHFLTKFKLARNEGFNIEQSLSRTFKETGKAILFTSIILFFGFLIVLFSNYPPAVYIGVLISLTLFTALIGDLFLLPILIRKFLKPRTNISPDQDSKKES